MIYYDNDGLTIRSMVKYDIEKFVNGFIKQGWHKSNELFNEYYNQKENNEKLVIVAEVSYAEAGPFEHRNIPEIVDFNVLIKYQKRGIGNKIMDIAENLAKEKSDYVSLGAGLHSGYGSAQRMYVKRGYIPDGTGVWYKGNHFHI